MRHLPGAWIVSASDRGHTIAAQDDSLHGGIWTIDSSKLEGQPTLFREKGAATAPATEFDNTAKIAQSQ
jgi:hypothetical protein